MQAEEGGPTLRIIWALVGACAIVQAGVWAAAGFPDSEPAIVQAVLLWAVLLAVAALATDRLQRLGATIRRTEADRRSAVAEVEQLRTQNAMLDIIARSVDVPLAFQALAQRIARLVPCDRVGLALLGENGEELQTYTARPGEDERRMRPRPEIVFRTDSTAIGAVVRSQEPLLITSTRDDAAEFLDVNVVSTAGFESAILIPLVSSGRSVGTLNVVSRQPNAFTREHIDILLPIAELLAIAYVAQQLQLSTGRYQTLETMSELTLSVAADINSALQTIIGLCDVMERTHGVPELQRDLRTIVQQAHRIDGLLEQMRRGAQDRMREAEASGIIPLSPEAFDGR